MVNGTKMVRNSMKQKGAKKHNDGAPAALVIIIGIALVIFTQMTQMA